MFDHIVLRRSEGGTPISIGQIAEALLYYKKVHLFIDRATLFNLVQTIGVDGILLLLRRTNLSAVYCEEMLATHTESVGASLFHKYIAFSFAGHTNSGDLKSPLDRLQYEIERQGIPKQKARRFSKELLELAPSRKLSGNHFLKGGIPDAAKLDLLDNNYFKCAIRTAVAETVGGYVLEDDFNLEIINSELGMCIFTNIDLERINQNRQQAAPPLESLTIAHLLSNILDARADLTLASFYGGDFVTSSITSAIIKVRHTELLRRTELNLDSRQQFSELVLPDQPSLAEVIDSGERSLDEFIKLLDRASKFKYWLHTVNPDEDLIRTYMRDITSEGWAQRLPVKTLRYMLTFSLDKINPIAGLAAGLADTFVLEKLISGWRPNHFVSGKFSTFVRGY